MGTFFAHADDVIGIVDRNSLTSDDIIMGNPPGNNQFLYFSAIIDIRDCVVSNIYDAIALPFGHEVIREVGKQDKSGY